MRFGIMSLQLDMLLPTAAAAGELAHDPRRFDHAALIRRIAAHGFGTIEIGADLALFLPHAFAPPAIADLQALKRELGLRYTVHLPLWSIEPSSPVPSVRAGSAAAIVESIAATQPLEPDVYVLHATGALAAEFYRMGIPEQLRAILLQQFQHHAHTSVEQILRETGIPSRQLAIETVEFPFELTVALAEQLDLSLCFDTGHVLVGFAGPVDIMDALEVCLPRLAEVHLHDGPWQGPERTIGYGKDHQRLGRGDLDVARFLDRLAEARFAGPLVFELSLPDALASLDHIRQLRPGLLAPAS